MAILSRTTIAATGKLQHDITKIKKWVEANGGRWCSKPTSKLTHLIATQEAWKAKNSAVKKAQELGAEIVTLDWLEDSLQRKRYLKETKYTFESIDKIKKQRKTLKRLGVEADGKKFIEGCTLIRELTGSGMSDAAIAKVKISNVFFFQTKSNPGDRKKKTQVKAKASASPPVLAHPLAPAPPIVSAPAKPHSRKDLYHYYQDATGFEYKITLVRSRYSTNSSTRYQVGLLESHAKPHTYATIVQYMPMPKAPPMPTGTASPQTGDPLKGLREFLSKPQVETSQPMTGSNANATQDPPGKLKPLSCRWPEVVCRGATNTPTPQQSSTNVSLPSPEQKFTTHVCPLNSTYDVAWRAFRDVFRDLTLLRWEDRFDDKERTLQKMRAKVHNSEPFIYHRPLLGMPTGIVPQGFGFSFEDLDDGYRWNKFGLPALECPLSRDGMLGSDILLKSQVS